MFRNRFTGLPLPSTGCSRITVPVASRLTFAGTRVPGNPPACSVTFVTDTVVGFRGSLNPTATATFSDTPLAAKVGLIETTAGTVTLGSTAVRNDPWYAPIALPFRSFTVASTYAWISALPGSSAALGCSTISWPWPVSVTLPGTNTPFCARCTDPAFTVAGSSASLTNSTTLVPTATPVAPFAGR